MIITNKTTIHSIVYKCYEECPRSQLFYHDFAGMSLIQIADNFLEKYNEFKNIIFKTIFDKNDLVGYYGIVNDFELPCLWTFFIRPKYRKTDLLWTDIKNTLPNKFISSVYQSNTPAIKYLLKNGGKEIILNTGIFYMFEEDLCQ